MGPNYDRNPSGIHRESLRQEELVQNLCSVVFASNGLRQSDWGVPDRQQVLPQRSARLGAPSSLTMYVGRYHPQLWA